MRRNLGYAQRIHAGAPCSNDFRRGAGIGSNDRQARGHRFHQRQAKTFVERGKYEHRCAVVDRRQEAPAYRADEVHAGDRGKLSSNGPGLPAGRADDHQRVMSSQILGEPLVCTGKSN